MEAEISINDAINAQNGPEEAFKIIIKYQKMGLFKYV